MKHEPPRTTEQVAAGTTPPPPPGLPNPAVVEEVGSRALSDALRSSFVIVKILMVGLVILFFFSASSQCLRRNARSFCVLESP
jgi:hypothetical protein